MSTKIKICGIRRPEDCAYINEAVPDYAGFIFWDKSFRYVDASRALQLRALIDERISTVGVFVDETPEHIAGIVRSGAISIVQLHGYEDSAYIRSLREMLPADTLVWKAYKVRSTEDIREAFASEADEILLDNGYGTGICFDHSLLSEYTDGAAAAGIDNHGRNADPEYVVEIDHGSAETVSERGAELQNNEAVPQRADGVIAVNQTKSEKHRNFILAGGLTPENIPDAIARFAPYMIDISSGVETDKLKDRDKILRAVQACRES